MFYALLISPDTKELCKIEGMADRSAAQEDSGKGPMARERMQSK